MSVFLLDLFDDEDPKAFVDLGLREQFDLLDILLGESTDSELKGEERFLKFSVSFCKQLNEVMDEEDIDAMVLVVDVLA